MYDACVVWCCVLCVVWYPAVVVACRSCVFFTPAGAPDSERRAGGKGARRSSGLRLDGDAKGFVTVAWSPLGRLRWCGAMTQIAGERLVGEDQDHARWEDPRDEGKKAGPSVNRESITIGPGTDPSSMIRACESELIHLGF